MADGELDASVDEYLDWLAVERGLSPRSLEAYASDLGSFVRGLDARKVRRPGMIGSADVRAHLAWLSDRGLAARSQARSLAAVRGYLRFLVRTRRLADDPTADLRVRRPGGALPRALVRPDATRLVTADTAGACRERRDRALLEVLYACGLRVSEVTGLRLAQVNLDAGWLTVVGKGRKERIVPIGEPARDALVVYLTQERPRVLRGRRSDFVFLGPRGRPLTRQAVWKLVKRRAAVAAVETNVSPHTLRHTFATHLVGGGADLRVVQALLGHADIGTTQVYTHVAPERLRTVHRRHHPRA